MWGVDEAVSNGACSDSQPVNGTQHSSNTFAADTTSCRISTNSENGSTHGAACSPTDEKTASTSLKLKCAVCHHSANSEASDVVASCGDASSSADTAAKQTSAASQNCNSEARTNRLLYSDNVTDDDDDGYLMSNTHQNTVASASDVATGPASKSVCSDYFSTTNGVDVTFGLPQTRSVDESVHSDVPIGHSNISHSSVTDGTSRCLASEQISSGAEVGSSSTNTDLTEALTGVSANADLCDDGYIDEIDIVSSSTEPQHGQTAAWFVETDAGLDDFIDADMPHNAAVAGSPSSSSLSSTHDEPGRILDTGSSSLTDNTAHASESNSSVNLEQQLWHNLELNLTAEKRDRGSGLHSQNAVSRSSSQAPPSHSSGRCLESDNAVVHASRGVNVQNSNPTSESRRDTPPVSLPSPSEDHYGTANYVQMAAEAVADQKAFEAPASHLSPRGEYYAVSVPAAAEFLTGAADEQVFEDNTLVGSSSRVKERSVAHGAKQSRCCWLPVGPSDSDLPTFGCWSCLSMMSSASLGLPAGCAMGMYIFVRSILEPFLLLRIQQVSNSFFLIFAKHSSVFSICQLRSCPRILSEYKNTFKILYPSFCTPRHQRNPALVILTIVMILSQETGSDKRSKAPTPLLIAC